MKKTVATIALLASTSAFAQNNGGLTENEWLTFYTFISPAASSFLTSEPQKVDLEMAREDAIKFVASQGKGNVSAALRAAIDEVNAKLVAAGIEAKNDNDAAALVVFINAINAKK